MSRFILLGILGILVYGGCDSTRSGYGPTPTTFKFNDDVQSNAEAPENIDQLTFVNRSGENVKLADYIGQKNVLLVFMRGFSGALCPFCQTQTSRLISNYSEFEQRNTEILLVYPGAADTVEPFLATVASSEAKEVAKVPFPILLDEELKAVDFFEIRASLAMPSTYILDQQGQVRFAYVGTSVSDRPSIAALLQQLDLLQE